jgi:hypothetical protein
MLTVLILLLAAADFEPEYENTVPPKDEAIVVIGPSDESPMTPPLANADAIPENHQFPDETFEQNLDDINPSGIRVTSPYRIPLTILTALVCGLLFLFFRQTE